MTRATNTPTTLKRRKKFLKRAKGYYGSKHKLFKTAKEQVMNALDDAYSHRKKKPGNYRRLWIIRLNNACREHGLSYSRFIRLKNLAQVKMDLKQLTQLLIHQPEQFSELIAKIKNPWPSLSA